MLEWVEINRRAEILITLNRETMHIADAVRTLVVDLSSNDLPSCLAQKEIVGQ